MFCLKTYDELYNQYKNQSRLNRQRDRARCKAIVDSWSAFSMYLTIIVGFAALISEPDDWFRKFFALFVATIVIYSVRKLQQASLTMSVIDDISKHTNNTRFKRGYFKII